MKTKVIQHFIDLLRNPFLIFFLFYKYGLLFLGEKTKKIELKGNIINPSLSKSFIRWGDGETNSALGISFIFESSSYFLKKKLLDILYYGGDKIILGLPLKFILKSEKDTKYIKIWRTTRLFFYLKLNKYKDYSDAFYFRDIGSIDNFIKFYFGKKLFVISNKNTLYKIKGIIKTIGTFEIPLRNSFKDYRKIKIKIIKELDLKDREDLIILISGGPFAKVLSYDLTLENNYICHDIGAIFDIYFK